MVKQLFFAALLPAATYGTSLGALRGAGKADPEHKVHESERFTVEKHTYQVATDSTIIHVPASAEEKAAVDAVNAYNAANSATQAAHVASAVAAHSADVSGLANAALDNAHNVLKEARTDTDKVNVDQKESLRRAQKTIAKEMNHGKVEEVSDSGFVKASSSLEADLEDVQRLRKLQYELDETLAAAKAHNDVEAVVMEGKLQGLKSELDARNDGNARLKAELAELERMVAELESAEKGTGHDEVKVKIEKMRQRVQELEARAAKEKEVKPDTGSLTFELPPKKQLPLRTLVTGQDDKEGCGDCSLPVRIPPKH